MNPKGFAKISVSKMTDLRLQEIRKKLTVAHPELVTATPQHPEGTIPYNTLIWWMCDIVTRENLP